MSKCSLTDTGLFVCISNVDNEPLYPFGYGLSYTQFQYSSINLSQKQLKKGGKIIAKVTLTNSGKYDGEEVVQLYIRDLVGSITRPLKELKGFQKIHLKAGESKTVTFEINEEMLKFYNNNLQFVSEPGTFKLFIGTNSRDVQEIDFELI